MKLGLVAVALGLSAATGSVEAALPETGLHGFVRKSPIAPICRTDACDGPAAGVTLVFTRSDGARVRTVTRKTGFYRVLLPAGRYAVAAAVGRPLDFMEKAVRVVARHDGRVDFHIDTGIQ